jgi:hypothetical protein
MIYKIAGAYAKTCAEREDIISETVLQLWKTSGRFEGNCKPSTWIYRVAVFNPVSGELTQVGTSFRFLFPNFSIQQKNSILCRI